MPFPVKNIYQSVKELRPNKTLKVMYKYLVPSRIDNFESKNAPVFHNYEKFSNAIKNSKNKPSQKA